MFRRSDVIPAQFAPGLMAASGFAATLYLFWPGFMTWDSTLQYMQAVTGKVQNPHPPIMAYLWMLTRRVIEGPGGMLVLQAAGYWSGFALIACAALRRPLQRTLAIALLGFFPPVFWLLPTIWKDNGFLAAMLLAIGLQLSGRPRRRALRSALVLLLAFYAFAVRVTGPLAVLPLLWFALGAEAPQLGVRTRLLRCAGIALLFVAATLGLSNLGVERLPYRAAVPIWDLARMSQLEQQILIPDYVIRNPKFDLERLERIGRPNRASFHDLRKPFTVMTDLDYEHLTPEQVDALLAHWIATIRAHPRSYLAHRLHVTKRLFLEPDQRIRHRLQSIPGFRLDFEFVQRPGYAGLDRWVKSLVDTPLYVPAVYAALALALLPASGLVTGWRRSAVRMLCVGGLLSVAPLPIISPSIDFRYTLWCTSGSLLALFLWLTHWLRRMDSPGKSVPQPLGGAAAGSGAAHTSAAPAGDFR